MLSRRNQLKAVTIDLSLCLYRFLRSLFVLLSQSLLVDMSSSAMPDVEDVPFVLASGRVWFRFSQNDIPSLNITPLIQDSYFRTNIWRTADRYRFRQGPVYCRDFAFEPGGRDPALLLSWSSFKYFKRAVDAATGDVGPLKSFAAELFLHRLETPTRSGAWLGAGGVGVQGLDEKKRKLESGEALNIDDSQPNKKQRLTLETPHRRNRNNTPTTAERSRRSRARRKQELADLKGKTASEIRILKGTIASLRLQLNKKETRILTLETDLTEAQAKLTFFMAHNPNGRVAVNAADESEARKNIAEQLRVSEQKNKELHFELLEQQKVAVQQQGLVQQHQRLANRRAKESRKRLAYINELESRQQELEVHVREIESKIEALSTKDKWDFGLARKLDATRQYSILLKERAELVEKIAYELPALDGLIQFYLAVSVGTPKKLAIEQVRAAHRGKKRKAQTVRRWINTWEREHSYPGIREPPKIWWMEDNAFLSAVKTHIRENAQTKGKPNLTARSFIAWFNSQDKAIEHGQKYCERTGIYWLHRLGFDQHLVGGSSIYFDRHEATDVVKDRNERFLPEYRKYWRRTRSFATDGMTPLDDLADSASAFRKNGKDDFLRSRYRQAMSEIREQFARSIWDFGKTLFWHRKRLGEWPGVELDLRDGFLKQERFEERATDAKYYRELRWKGDNDMLAFMYQNGFVRPENDVPSGCIHGDMRPGGCNAALRVVVMPIQDETANFHADGQTKMWAEKNGGRGHKHKNRGSSIQNSGWAVEDGSGLVELSFLQTTMVIRQISRMLREVEDWATESNARPEAAMEKVKNEIGAIAGEKIATDGTEQTNLGPRMFKLAFSPPTYANWTVAQLQEELKFRGVDVGPKTTKPALQQKLREDEDKYKRSTVAGLRKWTDDTLDWLWQRGSLPTPHPQMAREKGGEQAYVEYAPLYHGLQADVFLRVGKGLDGYWTAEKFHDQFEHVLLLLELRNPGEQKVFLIDNSSNHGGRGKDGLSVTDMRVNDGKKGRVQHDTFWEDKHGVRHEQRMTMENGLPKGLRTVLRERGLIDVVNEKTAYEIRSQDWPPDRSPNKLKRAELAELLAKQADFIGERSLIEKSCEPGDHVILWGVKCHPELMFIEQKWGFTKPKIRAEVNDKSVGFVQLVFEKMRAMPLISLQRFARRARDTMALYERGTALVDLAKALKERKRHRCAAGSLAPEREQ